MRHDLPFDEIADAWGLSTPAFAEKDYYVTQALAAISRLNFLPLNVVFAGGTCLTKAHNITQRMSEDIDLKISLPPGSKLRGNPLQNALRGLRQALCAELLEIGFQIDPVKQVEVSNKGKFTRINMDYTASYGGEAQLRPHIQIEARFCTLNFEPIHLPATSIASKVLGEPPEIDQIPCITIPETAAEKLVALSWRVFSRSVNEGPANKADDERLVRHIYDLHMLRNLFDSAAVAELARSVALLDAEERKGQAPKFAADPEGSLRTARTILTADPNYATQYQDFMTAMVYGPERPTFPDAVATVQKLSRETWGE